MARMEELTRVAEHPGTVLGMIAALAAEKKGEI